MTDVELKIVAEKFGEAIKPDGSILDSVRYNSRIDGFVNGYLYADIEIKKLNELLYDQFWRVRRLFDVTEEDVQDQWQKFKIENLET